MASASGNNRIIHAHELLCYSSHLVPPHVDSALSPVWNFKLPFAGAWWLQTPVILHTDCLMVSDEALATVVDDSSSLRGPNNPASSWWYPWVVDRIYIDTESVNSRKSWCGPSMQTYSSSLFLPQNSAHYLEPFPPESLPLKSPQGNGCELSLACLVNRSLNYFQKVAMFEPVTPCTCLRENIGQYI